MKIVAEHVGIAAVSSIPAGKEYCYGIISEMAIDWRNIRAVFFDLDNTLLDHDAAARAAFVSTAHHYQLNREHDVENLFAKFLAINEELWAELRSQRAEVSYVRLQRFVRLLVRHLDYSEAAALDVAPGLSEFYLDVYDESGIALESAEEIVAQARLLFPYTGIITNGFAEQTRRKMLRFSWQSHFSTVVVAELFGVSKPDPRIFMHALSDAQLDDPAQAVYIGDHYDVDIVGAKNAGWSTVWFARTGIDRHTNEADQIVGSLTEIMEIWESQLIPVTTR